ncbi:MAG: nucleotidyltransferase family protein [Clostridia bacterium]|nr:nucleotidyltransferase family protein [Clostridia bacterium]
MNCTGIIAEYNPFHKGHEYHVSKTRSFAKDNFVIALMSGNFVQRGDIAIYNKFYRAQKALEAGVDMVWELPAAFSVSCAEKFAKAAVLIFEKSGVVDKLSFGSECGDINNLFEIAGNSLSCNEEAKARFKESLKTGISFARAQSEALSLPSSPNDVLGLEYIKAIKEFNAKITPIAIQRIGAMHDSTDSTLDGFQSASTIRNLILDGKLDSPVIPASSQSSEFSSMMLYVLRSMSQDEFALLPDVSEGLQHVLYEACREATSYADFLALSKSKRYTMARLRRIAICALLRIEEKLQDNALVSPNDYLYIKVLGMRKEASPILSELSKRSEIPIIISHSDTTKLSPQAKALLEKDLLSSDIYNILSKQKAFSDYTQPLIVV